MKVLVLGVSGMLGHKAYQVFKEHGFETHGIMRQPLSRFEKFGLFDRKKVIDGIDVTDIKKLGMAIQGIKPSLVINAIGVVKQVCDDPVPAITLNSLFPHQLAGICGTNKARLIQVSTDCVFSGKKGNYSEEDAPDADDLYGRSKLLGEVAYGSHLTIRTSIIGRELSTHHGLVEWFLSQKGQVNGYTKAVFSGLSTAELSRVIIQLSKKPDIKGLLNIGTGKIDKCSLLELIKKEFGRDDITIQPYGKFLCDRSLDISKMGKLGIRAQGYPEMVREMANDALYQ
ncbi:TPA: SDR family oxidoreductase [Candidatus Woesearchaeota archaeon]|nr:SDR family oxidoreductase [Candidatus Woesearchaeota archaeon]